MHCPALQGEGDLQRCPVPHHGRRASVRTFLPFRRMDTDALTPVRPAGFNFSGNFPYYSSSGLHMNAT